MKSPVELDEVVRAVIVQEELISSGKILEKALESNELYQNGSQDDLESLYVYYNIALNLILFLKNKHMNEEEYRRYSKLKQALLSDKKISAIYNKLSPVKFIHYTQLKSLSNTLIIDYNPIRVLRLQGTIINIDPLKFKDYDYSKLKDFDNIVVYNENLKLLQRFIDYLRSFNNTPLYILQAQIPAAYHSLPSIPSAPNPVIAPVPPTSPRPIDLSNLHCTKGLYNIGNSCYMNVVLQSLLSTIPFLQGLLNPQIHINNKIKSKGLIAKSFIHLINEFLQQKKMPADGFREHGYDHDGDNLAESIAPTQFKSVINSLNKDFNNEDEQDCLEFLDYLLDSLHDELNKIQTSPIEKLSQLSIKDKESTPEKEEENNSEKKEVKETPESSWLSYKQQNESIINLFQGQLTSFSKCESCGEIKTNSQIFNTLSLPIPTGAENLHDCLKSFQTWELLDSKLKCDHCKEQQQFKQCCKITEWPQVLIVCLKRFNSNLEKIDDFVEYYFDLKIDPSTYFSHTGSSDVEDEEIITKEEIKNTNDTKEINYKLYSVVNHQGDFQEGHYTNFSWKGPKNNWCFFNDDIVLMNVEKERVINADGYILFYAKI